MGGLGSGFRTDLTDQEGTIFEYACIRCGHAWQGPTESPDRCKRCHAYTFEQTEPNDALFWSAREYRQTPDEADARRRANLHGEAYAGPVGRAKRFLVPGPGGCFTCGGMALESGDRFGRYVSCMNCGRSQELL